MTHYDAFISQPLCSSWETFTVCRVKGYSVAFSNTRVKDMWDIHFTCRECWRCSHACLYIRFYVFISQMNVDVCVSRMHVHGFACLHTTDAYIHV